MVFVDGENLAIRYGKKLQKRGDKPFEHIIYEPNIYVWSKRLNEACRHVNVIRKHYYTSVVGDNDRIAQVQDELIAAGIEAPKYSHGGSWGL